MTTFTTEIQLNSTLQLVLNFEGQLSHYWACKAMSNIKTGFIFLNNKVSPVQLWPDNPWQSIKVE